MTVALAARGYSAEALQWAKSAPDSRSVRDCLAAWTEALILSGKSKDAVTAIDAEIADRSPADQTWILSRVALVLGTTGQPEQAGQMLTRARQVLTKTGTPSPAPFPELKQLCNLQLPDTSALRDAAVAATELAHSEAVLKQGDAWKTISLAQEFARAMAPSPTIARTPLANIRQFGDASVKTEIKRELRLLMDTEVDAAYKKYRANCQALEDAAIARFALQTEIVSAAVSWGLADQAWAEISQRAAESIDPTAVEPWLTTTVPYGIHEHYRVSGETGKLQTLLGAVPDKTFKDTKDLKVFYGAESLRVIAEGKETAAAKGLSAWRPRSENDSYWRQEMTLRLASQLVAAGKNAKALEYALAIDDSLLREMALELVAAQSTVAGDRTTAFEAARNPGLIPPDRVALLRGLVGGLPAE